MTDHEAELSQWIRDLEAKVVEASKTDKELARLYEEYLKEKES
jgi:hypothetical protein